MRLSVRLALRAERARKVLGLGLAVSLWRGRCTVGPSLVRRVAVRRVAIGIVRLLVITIRALLLLLLLMIVIGKGPRILGCRWTTIVAVHGLPHGGSALHHLCRL